MTYAPLYSELAQSIGVAEKYLLDLLVAIVVILQQLRINVHFIFNS